MYNTTNKYLPYAICLRGQAPEPPEPIRYRFVLNNPYYNIDALQRSLLSQGYTSANPLRINYGIARSDGATITALYATANRLYSVTETGNHYFTPGVSTLASIASALAFRIPEDLLDDLREAYQENVIIEEE